MPTIACLWCGAIFTPRASQVSKGQGRFCSQSCGRRAYLAGHYPPVERVCEQCSRLFTTSPGRVARGRGRFCSVPCRASFFAAIRRATTNARYSGGRAPDHPLAGATGELSEHRRVLYEKIGPGPHACHWCGVTVEWMPGARTARGALTVDHLDNDGRNNGPDNLVPSCHRCNVNRQWGRDRRSPKLTPGEVLVTKGRQRPTRGVMVTCEQCGVSFPAIPALRAKGKARFCSRSCASKR